MLNNTNNILVLISIFILAACSPATDTDSDTVETATVANSSMDAISPGMNEATVMDTAASGSVPGSTAQDAIEAVVEALGGAERINAVNNITMQGYGHYAYQNGGGNITPLPNAPQKYIAANDLRRIYDIENNRYYQQERRNDLFPFAAYGGHSFALRRQVMDDELSYTINQNDQAAPGGDSRDLRMWMHTNPVVAVRAAQNPANTLDNRREVGGLTLVDITLAQGDKLTLAIRPPANLPAWISWNGPNVNLGEVTYKTHYSGFIPYDGVYLPLGYNTKLDWRDVEYLKMWIDGYLINAEIPGLAAPAAVTAAAPVAEAAPREILPLAQGIWRIGGSVVIEFNDHLSLFEVGSGPAGVHEIVELANTIVPGKQVTEAIQSHHHFDHSSGLRQAVAEGLSIITRRNNCVIFEEMTSHPAPNFPDDLERSGNTLNCIPVDDTLVMEDDSGMRVELYHTINNNHTADNIFAYIPRHRMIIEADIASAAEDLQWWGDSWIDNLEYRGLDVAVDVPIHDIGGRGIWTYEATLDFIAPGIERVKEWCANFEEQGNFFPGCPAFVR